jgi:DNA anti-recombination protein RmuC
MKNYKVEAIMKFTDKEENGIKRNVGDIFETTKERYEILKQNNAVKLIEIVEETKKEIKEDKEVEKTFEEKPKKKKSKKK